MKFLVHIFHLQIITTDPCIVRVFAVTILIINKIYFQVTLAWGLILYSYSIVRIIIIYYTITAYNIVIDDDIVKYANVSVARNRRNQMVQI